MPNLAAALYGVFYLLTVITAVLVGAIAVVRIVMLAAAFIFD